jgi:hypothetical protein
MSELRLSFDTYRGEGGEKDRPVGEHLAVEES